MAEVIDLFWARLDRKIAAIEAEQQELLRQMAGARERIDCLPEPSVDDFNRTILGASEATQKCGDLEAVQPSVYGRAD
jgi:hypothetical protein